MDYHLPPRRREREARHQRGMARYIWYHGVFRAGLTLAFLITFFDLARYIGWEILATPEWGRKVLVNVLGFGVGGGLLWGLACWLDQRRRERKTPES